MAIVSSSSSLPRRKASKVKPPFLFGTSEDIHKLSEGNGLILAGTSIPCEYSIVAHSDGDLVLHCLSEAIFLSLGEKDLGDQFKTHSSKTLNMDSSKILEKALEDMENNGYELNNVTVKVFLERPKLYNYKDVMKRRLSELLKIDMNQIGLALGTYEGLDAIGRGKAIMAIGSVALILKK